MVYACEEKIYFKFPTVTMIWDCWQLENNWDYTDDIKVSCDCVILTIDIDINITELLMANGFMINADPLKYGHSEKAPASH